VEAQQIAVIFLTLVRRGLAAGDVTRRHAPEVLAELVQGALAALFSDWGLREGFDPVQRAAELAALVADAIEVRPERERRSSPDGSTGDEPRSAEDRDVQEHARGHADE